MFLCTPGRPSVLGVESWGPIKERRTLGCGVRVPISQVGENFGFGKKIEIGFVIIVTLVSKLHE